MLKSVIHNIVYIKWNFLKSLLFVIFVLFSVSAMVWMFVVPQNLYVEILMSNSIAV